MTHPPTRWKAAMQQRAADHMLRLCTHENSGVRGVAVYVLGKLAAEALAY